MIKINLSDSRKQELQDKHWNWFKRDCLPSIKSFYQEIKDDLLGKKMQEVISYIEEIKGFYQFLFSDFNSDSLIDFIKIEEIIDTNLKDKNIYKLIVGDIKELKIILECLKKSSIHIKVNLENKTLEEEKRVLTHFISSIFDYESKLPGDINGSNKNNIFSVKFKDELDKIGKLNSIENIRKKKELIERIEQLSFLDLSSIYSIHIKDTIISNINKEIKSQLYRKTINNTTTPPKEEDILILPFDYKRHSFFYPNEWSKYHIVYELDLKTCPYCNRSFINPYFSDDGKTRADLDHFLPKKKYPYFAVSLFNLVPCCKVCNSSFKGSKEMDLDSHLHPHDKGMENIIKFTINTTDSNVLKGMSEDFLIDYYPVDSTDYQKAKENLELFKIKELYNFHKDYVVELIKKHIVYNSSYIEEMLKEYPQLFQDKKEVLQFIIANYIDDNDLDKRIFSKLTKDISEELGLLDLI